MRKLILIALMVSPAHSAEICVQEALSNCCHPQCDVFQLTTASGYSTDGVPPCGTFGQFTISSSSTDPYQSQGELAHPLSDLYLWATVGGSYGFRSMEEVTVTGDMYLWEFNPLHPAVDWDATPFATTWTFWVGCLYEAPTLLANIVVQAPPTSVEPESWGRIKALWR